MIKKNILILGGGFAGLEAAIFLRKKGYEVALISNREFMYVYPISIWIPTKEIDFNNAKLSLKELSNIHGFEFIQDEVESINAAEKIVKCKNGEYKSEYLVIAIGASKIKMQGSECFNSICGSPDEALKIKDELDRLIQKGSGVISIGFGGNPKDKSAVRGGPAFEVLFNIHNKLKKLGIRDKFELNFFAPMKEPGAKMGKKALSAMDMMFSKMKINKFVGKKIPKFECKDDKKIVWFEDASKLESDMIMFIPGGAGHPVFKNSDLPLNDAGFIKINDYCEVEGFQGVYAIGDSAAMMSGPEWKAKQGHIAEVMAKNVAHNIDVDIKGNGQKESYVHHLNIICVMDTGDGAAFVYRDEKKAIMIPMPFIGHLMKKGWGWYYKNSKLNKIPRLPGL